MFSGLICDKSTGDGINLHNCSEITVSNNLLVNFSFGIFESETHECAFVNNTFISCKNGIYSYEIHNNTYIGNDCFFNEFHGLIIEGNFCTFSNNNCSYGNNSGITIKGDNCVLSKNYCSFNGVGVWLLDSKFNIVDECIFTNNSWCGVYFRNSYGNNLTRNTFSENNESAIWNYYRISPTTYSNNTIWNNQFNLGVDEIPFKNETEHWVFSWRV